MNEVDLEGFLFGPNITIKNKLQIDNFKSYTYLIDTVKKFVRDCIRIKFPAIYIAEDRKILFLHIKTKKYYDSLIYKFILDDDLNPIDNGGVLKIRFPKPPRQYFRGPEDSRLIEYNKTIYLLSTMMAHTYGMKMHLIDSHTGQFTELYCLNKALQKNERNWAPFIYKENLYFAYSIDPLRIMKHLAYGRCKFVHNADSREFNYDKEILRGGTQFELYKYPYFISFCRTAFFANDSTRFPVRGPTGIHKMFLVVMRVNPFRIVFIGGPIILPPYVIKSEFLNLEKMLEDHSPLLNTTKLSLRDVGREKLDIVNDPTSFSFQNPSKNSIFLGLDINASSCILLKLSGLNKILDRIIRLDSGYEKNRANKTSINHDYPVQRLVKKRMQAYFEK